MLRLRVLALSLIGAAAPVAAHGGHEGPAVHLHEWEWLSLALVAVVAGLAIRALRRRD